MKKSATLFLLLFSISLATAAPSLNFQHNETQPGEPILATITTVGEFTEQIESSDVTFFEGRRQVSFEHDITFYDGTHYLYAYTTRPGNFSIQIENILYKEDTILQSTTISETFEIKVKPNQTSTEILSIKPGFIFTLETPKINLINIGNATLNIIYNETEVSLQPQVSREITLDPQQIFSKLIISSYKDFSIPIIYPPANSSFVSPSIQLDLRQDPELLLAELFTNIEAQETIQLFNFGDENLTDIQATSDLSFIEINQPENMPPRGTQNLTLTINSENPGHFQGHVNVTYTQSEEQNTLSIPLSLFVLPEGSTPEDFELTEETCTEIGGTVCEIGEPCDGEATFTQNGDYCCLGTCQTTDDDSEGGGIPGWIWGVIIFVVLGIVGYYFYRKQKKTTPKNPEEQIKEISDKFEKRLTGTPETKRIKDGLTKT